MQFRRIKLAIISLAVLVLPSFAVVGLAPAQPTQATNLNHTTQFAACGDLLFGIFPSWHHYICQGEEIQEIDFENNPGQIWLIAAAILNLLTRLAGVVAFFFIIYSGFQYIVSQGNSEGVASGRQALIGSFVGLAIAIAGTATINFLAVRLGSSSVDDATGLGTADVTSGSAVQTIASIFLAIVGAVSVLYIVIGSFRYVYGAGDSNQVAQARKTIIYAVVGLMVAITASAIINYVVNQESLQV